MGRILGSEQRLFFAKFVSVKQVQVQCHPEKLRFHIMNLRFEVHVKNSQLFVPVPLRGSAVQQINGIALLSRKSGYPVAASDYVSFF
jgi:hypothetical protein